MARAMHHSSFVCVGEKRNHRNDVKSGIQSRMGRNMKPGSFWKEVYSLVGLLSFTVPAAVLGAQNAVVVWGSGAITNVPADVTNVASIELSGNGYAVLRDGRVRAWP